MVRAPLNSAYVFIITFSIAPIRILRNVYFIYGTILFDVNITGNVLRVTGEYCYITLKYVVFIGHI